MKCFHLDFKGFKNKKKQKIPISPPTVNDACERATDDSNSRFCSSFSLVWLKSVKPVQLSAHSCFAHSEEVVVKKNKYAFEIQI